MKKIVVDIKNGQFTIYPSGEILPSLGGYISKAYWRAVGQNKQLKVVFIKEDSEYTLNLIPGNVTFESIVVLLIEGTGRIELRLKEYSNSERTYYLAELVK